MLFPHEAARKSSDKGQRAQQRHQFSWSSWCLCVTGVSNEVGVYGVSAHVSNLSARCTASQGLVSMLVMVLMVWLCSCC